MPDSVVLIRDDGERMVVPLLRAALRVPAGEELASIAVPVRDPAGGFGREMYYLSGERDAAGRAVYRSRLQ